MLSNGKASGIASSGAIYVVDRGFNSPNRKCSIRDFDLARRRGCPGKPGAGNPHAGFYLGGEVQGSPRLLPTDHTIPHRRLMKAVKRRVADRDIRDLLWKFLRAGVMAKGERQETLTGTPQKSIVSPLAANIYLHELDRYMESNYLNLPKNEREKRRRHGDANFFYA